MLVEAYDSNAIYFRESYRLGYFDFTWRSNNYYKLETFDTSTIMNLDAYSTKDIDNYQRLYVLQASDVFALSKFGNIEEGEVLMSLTL